MRMPRFRFTVRRMMVAMAVVAVLCGGEVLRRRRAFYLERADLYAKHEDGYLRSVADLTKLAKEVPALREAASNIRQLAERAAARRRCYERAARYPWLAIPPDPPEPE
jgi:hypothetical protein